MLKSYNLQMKQTRKHGITCIKYTGGGENSDSLTHSTGMYFICLVATPFELLVIQALYMTIPLVPPVLQAP